MLDMLAEKERKNERERPWERPLRRQSITSREKQGANETDIQILRASHSVFTTDCTPQQYKLPIWDVQKPQICKGYKRKEKKNMEARSKLILTTPWLQKQSSPTPQHRRSSMHNSHHRSHSKLKINARHSNPLANFRTACLAHNTCGRE